MNISILINIVYILAAIAFILGFKLMSSPESARKGNLISGIGMLSAIIVTLMDAQVQRYDFILIGLLAGSVVGLILAYRTPMTGMPQMVGLLNGFGGLASFLVAWAEFHAHKHHLTAGSAAIIWVAAIIGAVTFTGSLIAWAKLEEKFISGKPITYKGQQIVTTIVVLGMLVSGALFAMQVQSENGYLYFAAFTFFSMVLGVLLTIPIGGADMPVVICLLNSYSGMAACASGFIIQNNLLIVAGALVGASGIILTLIMCKAMNRSIANVFLGGFGAPPSGSSAEVVGELKEVKADDAYLMLEAANKVVIVPGYGLAVSQAQHAVRELMEALEKNGAEVSFAIHPVAGRMPGHMNVLLAEANVSYDAMVEMDSINPQMENVDVCMIIGANDVVNPAAQEDKNSPLWGMPIIEAYKARTVIVMKRGKGKGFAGVENILFFRNNCRMLYGDAKASLQNLIAAFKGA
ncbi:MAG: NAD(P)(+) transhydrogenase (Re/Si-specific) subunit beta [Bacteroidetes bacterium]|uniref:NAD(P)(+) transhydrogenase (Re/Si-specific) subunit beta n=1 Tax=Phnomibacter sp. TaxID=2836217 RepID=UPI002FDDE88F|nr:NAD(P)(+) transhydrogenase (Re/Si-specific) subunit beta [Bacteroidota bacterium]